MLGDKDGPCGQKKVKVLGISCSPRREDEGHGLSRSEYLLEKIMKYSRDFGGQTEIIRLSDKKIKICEGCYSDSKGGLACVFPCIHQDDTNLVLQAIIDCDALVFSTPIYWGGVSSSFRILVEKMTALENNAKDIFRAIGKEPLEGKIFALLASEDSEGASMALPQVAWAFNHMGMIIVPYGMIFEPALLQRTIVKLGLRLIGIRKFEWIENSIRLAARNLVLLPKQLSGYQFDDYKIDEPRA